MWTPSFTVLSIYSLLLFMPVLSIFLCSVTLSHTQSWLMRCLRIFPSFLISRRLSGERNIRRRSIDLLDSMVGVMVCVLSMCVRVWENPGHKFCDNLHNLFPPLLGNNFFVSVSGEHTKNYHTVKWTIEFNTINRMMKILGVQGKEREASTSTEADEGQSRVCFFFVFMWTKMWTHCHVPECKADISHLRVVSEVNWGK